MNNNALWEIGAEMRELAEAISQTLELPETELNQEEKDNSLALLFNDWLRVGGNFNNKAEQVASYIRQQEAIAEARKNEAKRIQELAKQAEKKAKRLRNYLAHQMSVSDITKLETTTAKISIRKKPALVVLKVPPKDMPEYYQKIDIKANLSVIKEELKSKGIEVADYAELKESNAYSLVIK